MHSPQIPALARLPQSALTRLSRVQSQRRWGGQSSLLCRKRRASRERGEAGKAAVLEYVAAERTLREKKRKLNEEGPFFDPPGKVARLKARLEREAGRLEELLASWERREGAVVDARIRVVTDAKDAWKDACRAAQAVRSSALREECTVLREKLRWSEWMLDRAIGEAADMDVERILTSRRKSFVSSIPISCG